MYEEIKKIDFNPLILRKGLYKWTIIDCQFSIFADNLGQARLHLDKAPSEVRELAQTDQPVTLNLDQSGEQVRIQVCDRGQGIPLAQQSRIFERFYRGDENRARSPGGKGLGLSIVKTLVEGMGGQVKVRSQLNQGSVFTVLLPAPD